MSMQEGAHSVPKHTIPAIVFGVRGDFYALEQHGSVTLLPWLQRYSPASYVPGLPPWCMGLLNVRGTVQMIVDVGQVLGFMPCDLTESSRLIFIEHGAATLGLLVDFEIGVRYVRAHETPVRAKPTRFSPGVAVLGDQVVTVLDGALLIAHIAEQLNAPPYLR
jgi:purine-binding chemotaxis protein CheW